MISLLRRPANSTALFLVLLSIFAGALSFTKFDHCRNSNWASPDSYVHACYSDIPTLFGDRALDKHKWAYSGGEKAVEYPVVMGTVMWATSWLVPESSHTFRGYFDINIFFLALIFIGVVLLVWRIRPQYAYLLPLSPAVIASLYINWDLWGIVTMLAAIYFFENRRYSLSALLLGVSIATKFFPIFLLLPIVVIFYRLGVKRELIKYLSVTFAVWLLINLPVIVTTPSGWWHFYKLNLDRNSDWGSIWYALELFGLNVKHLNNLATIVLLAVLVGLVIYLLEISYVPSLAEVSFIVLASIICIGKVYSPQYVLWLVPLALIAIREKVQLPAFWIWQGGEVLYHLAIWQHLALVGGSKFGLSNEAYAIATTLRIAVTFYLVASFIGASLKRSQKPLNSDESERGRLADFLFGSASSYP